MGVSKSTYQTTSFLHPCQPWRTITGVVHESARRRELSLATPLTQIHMPYLLLTTYYLLFALLAWRRLHFAVLLIIATLPSYLIRFQVGPIPMTLLEGMLIIVFFAAAFHRIKKVRTTPREPTHTYITLIYETFNYPLRKSLTLPIGLFLIAATISLFIAPDLRAASGIWKAYFLEPILFFLILLDLKLHHPTLLDNRKIIRALSVSALLLSLYAIYQRFTGFGIPPPWDKELRVTSIFPYPNALGLFLAPLVPLFVARLLTQFRHSERSEESRTNVRKLLIISYWSLVILSSIASIIFAKSTGALVGISAGLLVMAFLHPSSRSSKATVAIPQHGMRLPHHAYAWLAMTTMIAIAVVIILSTPRISKELFLQDWSGHVRKTQWTETIEMLKDRPILGVGLSGYKTALIPYHKATYLEIFEYPHNIVLNFWSETGLLGLVAFVWLVIIFFLSTFHNARNPSPPPLNLRGGDHPTITPLKVRGGGGSYDPITIASIASMIVILIHGLVDVPYFKNDLAILFWIIYSLGLTQAQQRPE